MTLSNLPPGVYESEIPGNEPDREWDAGLQLVGASDGAVHAAELALRRLARNLGHGDAHAPDQIATAAALVAHADMRELLDVLHHLTDAAEVIAESLSNIVMNGVTTTKGF